jgi:hypothetical protein
MEDDPRIACEFLQAMDLSADAAWVVVVLITAVTWEI